CVVGGPPPWRSDILCPPRAWPLARRAAGGPCACAGCNIPAWNRCYPRRQPDCSACGERAMKPIVMAAALVVAGAALGGLGVQAGHAAGAPALAAIPDRAEDFQLTDHTRMAHRLYYY